MDARRGARIALVFAVIAVLPSTDTAAQNGSHRTVLTIHWGAETFPSNPILDAAIRQVVASRPDLAIDYFAEYLDSDRFPEEEASLALKDYIRRKYRGRKIDLVIAMSDPVRRFVLDHRDELFLDAPIIAAGATVPDEKTRAMGAGLTGIAIGTVYAETLRLVLTLHPATRHVFVVAKGTDEQNIEMVRAALHGFAGGVQLTHIAENTLPRLLSRVKEARPGSVILYVWHSQEEPGHVMYADQVARLVAQAATVPVYGTSDQYN